MSNEKKEKNNQHKIAVSYYGKKLYVLNPVIARKEPTKENVPDYGDEIRVVVHNTY